MAALSDKDLAIMIGDHHKAGAAALHQKLLKKLEPKPPSPLTRTGAFLSIALAIVSIVGAGLSIKLAFDPGAAPGVAGFSNPVLPIALFSVVASCIVLWCCMKVLQGYNTGANRINSVLAMITNSLIGSIMVLFAGFGQPMQPIILSAFGIANFVAIAAWFWKTTDCID